MTPLNSFRGFPDFGRPLAGLSGTAYFAYGGTQIVVLPGAINFQQEPGLSSGVTLDIFRPYFASSDTDGYAVLEISVKSQFDSNAVIDKAREIDVNATVTKAESAQWSLQLNADAIDQLLPQPISRSLPAVTGINATRALVHLDVESALLLESLIVTHPESLGVQARGAVVGVSPRQDASICFHVNEFVNTYLLMGRDEYRISYRSLLQQMEHSLEQLPVSISVGSHYSANLLAAAIIDRLVSNYGAWSVVEDTTDYSSPFDELIIRKVAIDENSSHVNWSLATPISALRPIGLNLENGASIAQWADLYGWDTIIRRHTSTNILSSGQLPMSVYSTMPAERIGLVGYGADLIFPPAPPYRPQSVQKTVLLDGPTDREDFFISLAVGEPLNYVYTPFAVVSDSLGVRTLRGSPRESTDALLRLPLAELPVKLVSVESSQDILELAQVHGHCHYQYESVEYAQSFDLDSGSDTLTIAIPEAAIVTSLFCTVISRNSDATLELQSVTTESLYIDRSSFAEYGSHQIDIFCYVPADESIVAIEVMPMHMAETAENIQVLPFSDSKTRQTYSWFATSPFSPGFKYRLYTTSNNSRPWFVHADWQSNLTINVDQLLQPQVEVLLSSEFSAIDDNGSELGNAQLSESSQAGLPRSSTEIPLDFMLFDDPTNASVGYYVPEFRLKTIKVSGKDQYVIVMDNNSGAYQLSIRLESWIPEALSTVTKTLQAIPMQLSLELSYRMSLQSSAIKRVSLDIETIESGNLIGRFSTSTIAERDEIYTVLTDPEWGAALTISKTVELEVPQPTSSNTVNVFNGILPIHTNLLEDRGFINIQEPPKPIRNNVLAPVTRPRNIRPIGNIVKPNFGGRINVVRREAMSAMHQSETALQEATRSSIALAGGTNARAISSVVSLNRPSLLKNNFKPQSVVDARTIKSKFQSALVTPRISILNAQRIKSNGSSVFDITISVDNVGDISTDYFNASKKYGPCGKYSTAIRLDVSLHDAKSKKSIHRFCGLGKPEQFKNLTVKVNTRLAESESVFLRLTDKETKKYADSNIEKLEDKNIPPVKYAARKFTFAQRINPSPFIFNTDLHPYIFDSFTPVRGVGGIDRHRVAWNNRHHTYFQDTSNPNIVYYFPDSFKVLRSNDFPRGPLLTIRVTADDDNVENSDVEMDYIVGPYVDNLRLAAARMALNLNFEPSREIEFQPFITSDVRFFADFPGIEREEDFRDNAGMILLDGYLDSLQMKLPQFNNMFDALSQTIATQFMGNVEVDVPDYPTEIIPFRAHLADLAGEYFRYEIESIGSSGFYITLTNISPLPVHLDDIGFYAVRNTDIVSGVADNVLFDQSPLAAADSLTVEVQFPPDESNQVQIDEVKISLANVRNQPDRDTMLDLILDRSMSQYTRTIEAKALASMFSASDSDDVKTIVAILVNIDGSDTVELNADNLSAEVVVNYPIEAVLLDQTVSDEVFYRPTFIYSDASMMTPEEPVVINGSLFYVSA